MDAAVAKFEKANPLELVEKVAVLQKFVHAFGVLSERQMEGGEDMPPIDEALLAGPGRRHQLFTKIQLEEGFVILMKNLEEDRQLLAELKAANERSCRTLDLTPYGRDTNDIITGAAAKTLLINHPTQLAAEHQTIIMAQEQRGLHHEHRLEELEKALRGVNPRDLKSEVKKLRMEFPDARVPIQYWQAPPQNGRPPKERGFGKGALAGELAVSVDKAGDFNQIMLMYYSALSCLDDANQGQELRLRAMEARLVQANDELKMLEARDTLGDIREKASVLQDKLLHSVSHEDIEATTHDVQHVGRKLAQFGSIKGDTEALEARVNDTLIELTRLVSSMEEQAHRQLVMQSQEAEGFITIDETENLALDDMHGTHSMGGQSCAPFFGGSRCHLVFMLRMP